MEESDNLKNIVFGGGCFWCVESCFNMLKGIHEAISGYSGGITENPTYEEVCTGKTGHAEVVLVKYDPSIITLSQLMDVFFFLHDPTQLNRQGNDIGTQYRSVVYYANNTELEEIVASIKKSIESKRWNGEYVTEISKLEKFWPAEKYHQGYFWNNQNVPYCTAVVGPKIKKFIENYTSLGMID